VYVVWLCNYLLAVGFSVRSSVRNRIWIEEGCEFLCVRVCVCVRVYVCVTRDIDRRETVREREREKQSASQALTGDVTVVGYCLCVRCVHMCVTGVCVMCDVWCVMCNVWVQSLNGITVCNWNISNEYNNTIHVQYTPVHFTVGSSSDAAITHRTSHITHTHITHHAHTQSYITHHTYTHHTSHTHTKHTNNLIR